MNASSLFDGVIKTLYNQELEWEYSDNNDRVS